MTFSTTSLGNEYRGVPGGLGIFGTSHDSEGIPMSGSTV